MVTDADRYWAGPQGAADFKHEVVKGQIGAFAGKLGQSGRRTVHYLDGYAGPGTYGDENKTPGSPLIALEIAAHLEITGIDLRAQFIEQRKDYCKRLTRLLAERNRADWLVHQGDCHTHLETALSNTGTHPLLVFLDPFGLGIPFDLLVERILRRDSGGRNRKPTEVIANFSDSALHRLGGVVETDFSGRDEAERARLQRQQAANQASLKAFLGNENWRHFRAEYPDTWVRRTMDDWRERLCQSAPGWRSVAVPVSDRWDGPPSYQLVLLSTNTTGLWEFNESASKAYQRMHKATYKPQDDEERLFSMESLYLDPRETWIRQLVTHLNSILDHGFAGVCGDHMELVYGPLLGRAREMHLRSALRRMFSEGALINEPKGPLHRYLLRKR